MENTINMKIIIRNKEGLYGKPQEAGTAKEAYDFCKRLHLAHKLGSLIFFWIEEDFNHNYSTLQPSKQALQPPKDTEYNFKILHAKVTIDKEKKAIFEKAEIESKNLQSNQIALKEMMKDPILQRS